MSHVITLAARELREKRMTLLLMLGMGMVPVLVPMLPKLRQEGGTDLRNAFVLTLLILLPAGIAIISGATVLGRDLQEKRLGFYFSRPLAGLSIWGGKMLGAFLLVVASAFLVALPATFFGSGLNIFNYKGDPLMVPIGYLIVLLALLAFSHAAGTILRSRSAWILLDVTLLIVVSYVVVRVLGSFRDAGATDLVSLCAKAVVFFAVTAALVAGALQVVRGRTDIRQGHRVLSMTLWSILGAMALTLALYAGWVFALEARDLNRGQVQVAAPRGSWVVLRGTTAGRFDHFPGFLVNLDDKDDKRSIPLSAPRWSTTARFSNDGQFAAWVKPISGDRSGTGTISWARLAGGRPEVHHTDLTASLHSANLVFSPDRSRLAVIEFHGVSVVDFGESRLLSSAQFPRHAGGMKAFFVGNDVVRFLFINDSGARSVPSSIFELNVADRSFKQTGDLGFAQGIRIPAANAQRMIFQSRVPDRIEIRDSRTGAVVTPVALAAQTVQSVALLSDGALAIISVDNKQAKLSIMDWDGNISRTVSLGTFNHVLIGAEPSPGYLTVATTERTLSGRTFFKTQLIDLAQGKIVRTFHELWPRSPWMRPALNPTVSIEPGGVASRLYDNPGSENVVTLDPTTGLTTHIIRATPLDQEPPSPRVSRIFPW